MTTARDAGQVRAMFDRIAPGYDRANTVLSFGRDRTWRRRAAEAAALSPGDAALDIACGSGQLTRELRGRVGRAGRVVGLDFSERMLAVASAGQPSIEYSIFDAATVAFGLRNLAYPDKGLAEMRRVVRPGGRLVVLEFLRPPQGMAGRAYELYLRHILPRIGGLVAGDRGAYRYLSDTVDTYLTGAQLLDMADLCGWNGPQLWRLNLGTVGLLRGRRLNRRP
jgi:demethylmenaquinone methyltransferase/2-methoxy-6-polyprenyl-1,4-benzoquinol methylase